MKRPTCGRLLRKGRGRGSAYITDEDARPLGGAHPYAHLWDNGPDAAAELDRMLAVRQPRWRASAERDPFRSSRCPAGRMLVPLYLLHRYQTEAAAKEIGGLDYRYACAATGRK